MACRMSGILAYCLLDPRKQTFSDSSIKLPFKCGDIDIFHTDPWIMAAHFAYETA